MPTSSSVFSFLRLSIQSPRHLHHSPSITTSIYKPSPSLPANDYRLRIPFINSPSAQTSFFSTSSYTRLHATSIANCSHDPLPPASPSSQPTRSHHPKMSGQELSSYLAASHDRIFKHNEEWAAAQKAADPAFFEKLAAGQNPEYLWISCSDSRIPAEVISGLGPGEAFIHRNIANLVCATDMNAMSVLEYAVKHLQVKHIVVCGHYGCGGVKAAMTPKNLGVLNPWLRNIRDVYRLHEAELDSIIDGTARYNRLVELNVLEQCRNVIKVASVQEHYAEYQYPIVHGWVFGLDDGRLTDLKVDHEKILRDIQKIYNLCE